MLKSTDALVFMWPPYREAGTDLYFVGWKHAYMDRLCLLFLCHLAFLFTSFLSLNAGQSPLVETMPVVSNINESNVEAILVNKPLFGVGLLESFFSFIDGISAFCDW